MKYTYLLVNFFTVIVPFIFSFHPKIKFYKAWKAFFPSLILTGALFIIMDEIFTVKGVWGFNPSYVIGYYLFHLPIEEILFFICIPFSSVFTYHCFSIYKNKNKWLTNESLLSISLIVFLLSIGPVFFTKLYTTFTFISLGLLLLFLKYYLDVKWLGTFYFSYLILLLPFLIVNGVLTGTGLDNPVVWYNDNENMGIRLLTIPVEDVFYGMGLILLNVALFELFKKRLGILTNNA